MPARRWPLLFRPAGCPCGAAVRDDGGLSAASRIAVTATRRELDPSGPPVSLDQIVVTAGSNQLLHLVSESLLDPGDIVLCASPTYFVYLGLLAGVGAAVGVASDADGMIPEALEETLLAISGAGRVAPRQSRLPGSVFRQSCRHDHAPAPPRGGRGNRQTLVAAETRST